MTTPEHLDPESTAPDLPDGYDPDGGWKPTEWLGQDWVCATLADSGECVGQWRCGGDLGCIFGPSELRPADFDDEEWRP